MLQRLRFALVLSLCLCGSFSYASPPISPTSSLDQRVVAAYRLLEHLRAKKYAEAHAMMSEAMKKALPQAQLQGTWAMLTLQAGAFDRYIQHRIIEKGGFYAVFIAVQHKQTPLEYHITFAKTPTIEGFFVRPYKAAPAVVWQAPAYADPKRFREEKILVGGDKLPLQGALTLPQGTQKIPMVILLSGSGPNDMDSTIEGNKPLRDLAWGLASRGIGVLRYNKRTREHGKKLDVKTLTMREEYLNDAHEAILLLQRHPRTQRIYLLGHSLGCSAALRVAQEYKAKQTPLMPDLAGLLLLAGTPRPLDELIWEQFNYIFSLSGTLTDAQRQMLDKLKTQRQRLKQAGSGLKELSGTELPLGMSGIYWHDLLGHPVDQIAKRLTLPMLFLQGGRDYQVTAEKDFKRWKEVLSGQKNAHFQLFPSLNHLFFAGAGRSTPQEYSQRGNVDASVIEALVAWIKP